MTLFSLFDYEFIRHALLAGSLAGILSGLVGYFLVLRQLTFVGHALGHIGFAGAAGAGLVGLSPWTGQLLFSALSAIGMGFLGDRLNSRDISVGVILAFALGLGTLFLHFYTAYTSHAMSVLFGNLLGVSSPVLRAMMLYTSLSIVAIGWISKPLLLVSLEPDLAEARGVSLRMLSIVFLTVSAIAVVTASQIVGTLLLFTLLVGPAASALNWTQSPRAGILLTMCLSVLMVWFGIGFAFLTDWPISFWISTLSLIVYFLSVLIPRSR